jgi:hypothetical protein
MHPVIVLPHSSLYLNMRFFAKLMFICNCCFLAAALFHYTKLFQTHTNYPQPLNFVKGSIVILAEFGWIFNLLFVLLAGVWLLLRKPLRVPRWLLLFNALVLVFQIYYYFFDKS